MPCPKCSDTLKRCPDVQSSDCIKYVGENSECDIFCKGQSVSEVIEAIDAETCTIKTNTDVSSIDLNDYCDDLRDFYISKNYEDKTAVNFIDFLLSFDCNLQGQIDAINNSLTTFVPTVTADWSCLASSPCVTTGTVNLNTAIQNLINAFCTQQITINTQQDLITTLTSQIDNLEAKYTCLLSKVSNIDTQLNTKADFAEPYVSVNPNSCAL